MNKDEFDTGKVKFQNAYEYYDIMYNLYRDVIRKSFNVSLKNFSSIQSYYVSLHELFCFIEPFLDEDNTESRLKFQIAKIIKFFESQNYTTKDISISLNIKEKELEEYKLINTERSYLDDYFNEVSKILNKAAQYSINQSSVNSLLPYTKQAFYLLNLIKRSLAKEMKINKLTVPIKSFNPNDAIRRGYG